jgi:SAM-dependent methyltransferase
VDFCANQGPTLEDQAVHHLRFATSFLGAPIPPGARVLDFGCGKGTSVAALVALGYDAFGVDIADYWNTFDAVPSDTRQRLDVLKAPDYRLPFPAHHFDFCFSDQVFEHVQDYQRAFSEIVRVLKPRAVSVHRFPGPNRVIENHIGLPVPWLCYSRAYLTLWALAGRRSIGQAGFTWRETVEHNLFLMQHNNYPTKGSLRSIAHAAGAKVEFHEKEEFGFRNGGRFRPILDLADRVGLRGVALALAAPLLSRYMVLRAAD